MNIEAQIKDGEEEQVTFLQGSSKTKYTLNKNWGYLDRFLTVTAFKNSEHLTDIHKSDKSLKVNCNAGAVLADEVGTFGDLQVWSMPGSIANIVSMPKLEKSTTSPAIAGKDTTLFTLDMGRQGSTRTNRIYHISTSQGQVSKQLPY